MRREHIQSEIVKYVIKAVIPSNLLDSNTQLLVNPTGRFVIGGRQVVADSAGAWVSHGGGAAVGKNGSKVERCGAYAARWVARSLVQAGFAKRCSVQLAYISGRAEP